MKRLLATLLVLCAVLTLPLSVCAAGTTKFLHPYYAVSEDTLICLGAALPEGGTGSVSVGTVNDVPTNFSTVAREKLPTTVYCLVDTSVSMNYWQAQQQIEILKAISSNLGDGDSMVIATLGDELKESELLCDKKARKEAIGEIERKGSNTDIYEAVITCLDYLTTRSTYSANRCLVVLSDGIDCGRTGRTEQEAVDAAANATIPVYAVEILEQYPSSWAQNYAKFLKRLSDASIGGRSFSTEFNSKDPYDADKVGDGIWESIQSGSVIQVDLSAVQYGEADATLMLLARYETEQERYEDTITLYTVDLPKHAQEPEETVSPEPTQAEATETIPEEPSGQERNMIFRGALIAAAIVVVAVVVTVILVSSRKKAPQPIREIPIQNPPQNAQIQPTQPVVKKPPVTAPPVQGCLVQLTAIGNHDIRFDFFLPEHKSKTIGRDSRSNIVLNPKDNNLSGIHCEMEWDGNCLYVHDRNSTNGTFINGVPIKAKAWMKLDSGAVLRIGSGEYRVNIQRKTMNSD